MMAENNIFDFTLSVVYVIQKARIMRNIIAQYRQIIYTGK